MINIQKARISFKNFLDHYEDKDKLGFDLKITHTYHVVENARMIAEKLGLSQDDINLAELIALLHDIGRFEELKILKQFDSLNFDHASYGVKMLFEDNMIRYFIEDNNYDEIIKAAINNHSRLSIQDGLDDRTLLHIKIIRDADKLDNFRVKKEEKIEAIFPGKIDNKMDIENSRLSDRIYETVKKEKCVDIHDRETILDYWVCVLAFIFDLNFKKSYEIVQENDYVNILINRFNYNVLETKMKMENIRTILNDFIKRKINNDEKAI